MKNFTKTLFFAAAILFFAACEPTNVIETQISFNQTDTDSIYVQIYTELNFSVSVNIENAVGSTSFTVETPEWLTLTSEENTATFTGTPTEVGVYSFSLTATNNDNASTKEIIIVVTQKAEARIVLLEKFTGDQCVYCPWGADDIAAGIQGNEDKVIIVAHHVGYNEDKYTILESRPLRFFYGSGSTYAPAAMLNRSIVRGSVPVMGTEYVTSSRINAQLNKPSYVKVDFTTTYNAATKELKVDVSGILGNLYPNAKLNVYIIQEGLTGNQTGPVDAGGNYVSYAQYVSGTPTYTGTIQNYPHSHALRAVLSDTWGDALDVQVGEFSKSYTYIIPDNIRGVKNIDVPTDVDNMYVVVFVADYIKNTTENLGKSEVHNAAIKKILE